jgi:hypothetical protein
LQKNHNWYKFIGIEQYQSQSKKGKKDKRAELKISITYNTSLIWERKQVTKQFSRNKSADGSKEQRVKCHRL